LQGRRLLDRYQSPQPLRLVKVGRKSKGETHASDTVIAAVNALQETPWRVNKNVLAVFQEVVVRGLDDLGILPSIREREIPTKPVDIATNEVARKEYCRKAATAHGYNVSIRSRRIQVVKTLTVAEEFAEFERFYFPHQLDFRGRAYALPQWLSPQGPDYAKGLLMFADGKPIGDGQGPGGSPSTALTASGSTRSGSKIASNGLRIMKMTFLPYLETRCPTCGGLRVIARGHSSRSASNGPATVKLSTEARRTLRVPPALYGGRNL
jgi:hypothetical protein